jgi:hypothetical protein
MKHNEITVEGLTTWLTEEEVLYAESSRERKRLTCKLDGTLIVRGAGVVVYQGMVPAEAVEAYNAVTEKYKEPKRDFTI